MGDLSFYREQKSEWQILKKNLRSTFNFFKDVRLFRCTFETLDQRDSKSASIPA